MIIIAEGSLIWSSSSSPQGMVKDNKIRKTDKFHFDIMVKAKGSHVKSHAKSTIMVLFRWLAATKQGAQRVNTPITTHMPCDHNPFKFSAIPTMLK